MDRIDRPARVGLITDQTGALSFMGVANVNLATMVIDDINLPAVKALLNDDDCERVWSKVRRLVSATSRVDHDLPTAATFSTVFLHDCFGFVNVLLLLTTRQTLLLFDDPKNQKRERPLKDRGGVLDDWDEGAGGMNGNRRASLSSKDSMLGARREARIEHPNGNGNANDTDNLSNTFLRGLQQTDVNGVAQFETIFPGHYTGRTTHIHMVAHLNATLLSNNTTFIL